MKLELRDKKDDFIVTFKNLLSESVLKFILNEEKMKATTYDSEGKRYKGFVNDSKEIVGGKNELIEFFIRPGDRIIIKTEN